MKTAWELIYFIFIFSIFISCDNKPDENAIPKDRYEFPEPDIAIRLRYETIEKLRKSGCQFNTPDSSINGIKLQDEESAISVIGNKAKMDSLELYHFYTNDNKQMLTVTQHPGDSEYSMSIFRIQYVEEAKNDYPQLPLKYLSSEKGIKLGMTTKEVKIFLGKCYAVPAYSGNYTELYYLIDKNGG